MIYCTKLSNVALTRKGEGLKIPCKKARAGLLKSFPILRGRDFQSYKPPIFLDGEILLYKPPLPKGRGTALAVEGFK